MRVPRALHELIIDLRANLGGSEALGVQIASRLTDRTYLACAKQTRNDPHTPPEPVHYTAAICLGAMTRLMVGARVRPDVAHVLGASPASHTDGR